MNWRQKLYNLHSLRAAQLMTAAMMNAEEEPVVDQRIQRIRNMHEGGAESDSKHDDDRPSQQRSGRGERTRQRRRSRSRSRSRGRGDQAGSDDYADEGYDDEFDDEDGEDGGDDGESMWGDASGGAAADYLPLSLRYLGAAK